MADLLATLEAAPAGEAVDIRAVMDAMPFDSAGLLPAIAQDDSTGDVLMLAWMDRTALERTLAEGYACYYSRSRQQHWRKGETSGHLQAVRAVRFDCDGDAILLRVDQTGPACHTMRPNCFYLEVDGDRVRVISAPR